MLGSLDKFYGDAPIYVYLSRDTEQVIQSFTKRYSLNNIAGIMHGFGHGILQQPKKYEDDKVAELAEMYVDVVTDNIENFLKDKTKVVRFDIKDPEDSIRKIWEMAGIEGDVQKAIDEWSVKYNHS
jgi:ribosomal protein S13